MHYYGIDVHKRFCAFTCIDDGGRVIRRGRVANTPETLGQMVAPSGGEASAVLEATGNWTYIYDTLEPWVAELILAHPLMVRAIAAAKVKTDRIDADTLAQSAASGLHSPGLRPTQRGAGATGLAQVKDSRSEDGDPAPESGPRHPRQEWFRLPCQ